MGLGADCSPGRDGNKSTEQLRTHGSPRPLELLGPPFKSKSPSLNSSKTPDNNQEKHSASVLKIPGSTSIACFQTHWLPGKL